MSPDVNREPRIICLLMPAFCPQGRQRNYKHVEAWRSPLGSFKGPTLYFNEGEKGERLAFPFRMADGR